MGVLAGAVRRGRAPRLADIPRSDSECETILPKKSTVASKKLKTVPTTSAKRKPMTSTSSKCNKRPKTNVFGLYSDREDSTPRDSKAVSTRLLPSYIVTKVGGGAERRCHPTSGEFYVELKVFTREDAECPETDERWKKALLRLHCLLEDDSTQWEHLQRFVKDASLLFQEAEPAFYSEKMNVKR